VRDKASLERDWTFVWAWRVAVGAQLSRPLEKEVACMMFEEKMTIDQNLVNLAVDEYMSEQSD